MKHLLYKSILLTGLSLWLVACSSSGGSNHDGSSSSSSSKLGNVNHIPAAMAWATMAQDGTQELEYYATNGIVILTRSNEENPRGTTAGALWFHVPSILTLDTGLLCVESLDLFGYYADEFGVSIKLLNGETISATWTDQCFSGDEININNFGSNYMLAYMEHITFEKKDSVVDRPSSGEDISRYAVSVVVQNDDVKFYFDEPSMSTVEAAWFPDLNLLCVNEQNADLEADGFMAELFPVGDEARQFLGSETLKEALVYTGCTGF